MNWGILAIPVAYCIRFVPVAARGVGVYLANDRLESKLQRAIRIHGRGNVQPRQA
eukprot:CAMPEP_0117684340 /NCGR_PEP_ID=MMETSP0804-20121206/21026_1 /TAXON_ID=1074897 /ORGANISM="Tetraselmis astigmatica, Strain CCMP880" /LENGTH=54 /DNA_ID=CAMNT_0005495283 /DNA_START=220 /DNA_END=381 /DNA_ORIENTATION=+